MAPEQLKAFLDPTWWSEVGPTSDLFSLGLLLREVLTGEPPEIPAPRSSQARGIQGLLDRRIEPVTSVRRANPAVPSSLDSILRKCLTADRSSRYQGAADLVEDLEQFLARKPLRHATNTSKAERLANDLHRNRGLAAIMVGVLSASLLGWIWFRTPSVSTLPEFQQAARQLDSGRPGDLDQARRTLRRLHEAYPDSAWASVYLATALGRGSEPEKAQAARLFKEAGEQTEAQPALRARIAKEPNSGALRINLALRLIRDRDYDQARHSLRIALQATDTHLKALLMLADLERRTNHPEAALRHLGEAIPLSTQLGVNDANLYEQRTVLGGLFIEVADHWLTSPDSTDGEKRLETLCEQAEANFSAWMELRRRLPIDGGSALHEYHRSYYEGCQETFRAILADRAGQWEDSRRFSDKARVHFRDALKAASDLPAVRLESSRKVAVQEQRLSRLQTRHVVAQGLPISLWDPLRGPRP